MKAAVGLVPMLQPSRVLEAAPHILSEPERSQQRASTARNADFFAVLLPTSDSTRVPSQIHNLQVLGKSIMTDPENIAYLHRESLCLQMYTNARRG
jgi:hypothetical protein